MRKLKLQIQLSIDGFMAGPKGEQDWMPGNQDDELKKYIYNLTRPVDCIVLGRNYANVFIDSWQKRLKDPKTADSFARIINDMPKIVFSRTSEKINWKNTRLVKGDLIEEITKLKKLKGRDMIVYGGVSFVSSLIRAGLVDEYHFFINPVVLGEGISIFENLDKRQEMQLVYSTTFDCGIIAVCYIPRSSDQVSLNKMSRSADYASGK
jgi:dihydrofolate reductase